VADVRITTYTVVVREAGKIISLDARTNVCWKVRGIDLTKHTGSGRGFAYDTVSAPALLDALDACGIIVATEGLGGVWLHPLGAGDSEDGKSQGEAYRKGSGYRAPRTGERRRK
jgi:hypothetical protein